MPCITAILAKYIVPQLVRRLINFYESEGSLLPSQGRETSPYAQMYVSTSHRNILLI
jgi:hypothetical protein